MPPNTDRSSPVPNKDLSARDEGAFPLKRTSVPLASPCTVAPVAALIVCDVRKIKGSYGTLGKLAAGANKSTINLNCVVGKTGQPLAVL